MNPLIGQWQQPAGQPFPGLWFEFHEDGTFKADYSEMGILSSGTYSVQRGSGLHGSNPAYPGHGG